MDADALLMFVEGPNSPPIMESNPKLRIKDEKHHNSKIKVGKLQQKHLKTALKSFISLGFTLMLLIVACTMVFLAEKL